MLSLEERTELLLIVAEFAANKRHDATLRLLSTCSSADLLSEPELGLRLALAHYHFCHLAEARELVRELKEHWGRRGSDQLHRRLLQLEGTLLTESGDLDRAEAAYLTVLNSATAAADPRLVAFSTVGLSANAGIRGEWIRAVALGKDAMTAVQRIGDVVYLGACHQNLAMAYRELGLLSRADSHFEKAGQLYRGSGFDVSLNLIALENERALLISAAGDHRRAEAMVILGLARLDPLRASGYSVRRDLGEALRALGIVVFRQLRYREAHEFFAGALECARGEKVRLLEGEVCEALLNLTEAEGNEAEARRWAGEAARVYGELGAHIRVRRLTSRGYKLAAG